MDLVQRLEAERAALLTHKRMMGELIDGHVATLDELIGGLGALVVAFSTSANGSATNGATFRKVAKPTNGNGATNGHKNKPGAARDAVLAAIRTDWTTPAEIINGAPNVTKGSVYTLISAMARAKDIQRQGAKGSYKYRRKLMSGSMAKRTAVRAAE